MERIKVKPGGVRPAVPGGRRLSLHDGQHGYSLPVYVLYAKLCLFCAFRQSTPEGDRLPGRVGECLYLSRLNPSIMISDLLVSG